MSRGPLTERDLQKVQVLCERGVQRASEALTILLDHPVQADVSSAKILPPRAVMELVAGATTRGMAGLRCHITGEMGGDILLLFPLATVFRMLHALLGTPTEPRTLSGEEQSAVQEVGNILASSFLSELGDRLGRRVMHSIPQVQLGGVSGLMESMQQDMTGRGMEVLVVQARFVDPECAMEGRLFVLPELRSLQAVLEGPGAAEEMTA